ncbi:MAG: bifunctional folylpolyglutamate synthase/dihydrofolate synthase [Chloroflexi bacterium]|nr:bifunctional folylpolyglutamate synthase/dihydrofolate synthase [Chloroflexota bacterium]
MDYQQTLDYIYSFVDYGLKSRYKYSPETFDLTRMRTVLARLGDPQRKLPSVHVAGTKGKGSVAAMAASVLQAAGYKAGLYTSPHLHDFCERIQFDGEPIPPEALAALTTELRPLFDSAADITTFEITTALAHEWFARQHADFAVFEVGLGGRLDATNVLYPNVCAITSISYDHTQLLGKTLREIAEEKAGIIKPGAPVVSAPQQDEAAERIVAIAHERGARLCLLGRDWFVERDGFSLASQRFEIWREGGPRREFEIPLLGAHQVDNAAVVVALIEELRGQGFAISEEAISRGLAQVNWPGRFEIFRIGGKTVVLDCAHNRDSAAKLVATLKENFPGARPVLIFGASNDKDISGMLAELLPMTAQVIVAQADHPRASDAAQLADDIRAAGVALLVNIAHTVPQALAEAQRSSEPLILVTGSIFLVAEVRAKLNSILDF